MKIVCATGMPFAMEAFGTLGQASVLEGRAISAADVKEAEILAVRSTTQVNRRLLEGSRVRFVGTATIGTDHMDIPYLESAGIAWCGAPGCNANSVSEYFVAGLLCLARRHGFRLQGKTVGVVGVGNVGSRVVDKARALGLNVLQNDPPKREQTGAPALIPLSEMLPQCDIVTLHVPLTVDGPCPTAGLAAESFFRMLKPGAVFINAARGGVMDSEALLRALADGRVSHTLVDTWEDEPAFRTDLLARVDVGTPHIAGHSFEGKVNGTAMVYQSACRFLGLEPTWTPDALMPSPTVPEVTIDARSRDEEDILREVVRQVYDIERDDRDLRAGAVADDSQRARHFDRLRREYPMRREFRFTRVRVSHGSDALIRALSRLGFQT